MVLLATMDITEQKQAEKAIAHLAAIVESHIEPQIQRWSEDLYLGWRIQADTLKSYR